MHKVINFLRRIHGSYKVAILAAFYVLLTEGFKAVPYLNVLFESWEIRLSFVGLLALILFDISIQVLVVLIIILLILSVFGLATGLAIYFFMLVLLIDICNLIFRERRKA